MSGTRRAIPNDPSRRLRILRAALEVVREDGIQRTNHRAIAARAEVPLGSVTYYFDGIDDLLEQAFCQFIDDLEDPYHDALERARTPAKAEQAVVDLICRPSREGLDDVRVLLEMYVHANHHEPVERMVREWMHRSRVSLAKHFPAGNARALDALIEGWTTHSMFEGARPPRHVVETVVHAIATTDTTDPIRT